MTNTLARLTDTQTPPVSMGYVAERHPLLPSLILVWAPCLCVWTLAKDESFVTSCGQGHCVFTWKDAVQAIRELQEYERAEKPGPQLVQAPKEDTIISEAHSTSVSEALSEVVSEAISDMVSEGGPVD